jgi:hypothetical protein
MIDLDRPNDGRCYLVRPRHNAAEQPMAEEGTLREAFGVHEARVDCVHAYSTGRELHPEGTRERKLRVLRRAIRSRATAGHRAGDGDDVDHMRRPSCFEGGQKRPDAPHRTEKVDSDERLDPLRLELEEGAPTRYPGAANEQPERGVPLLNRGCHPADRSSIADVAHLVIGTDLVGERAQSLRAACNENRPPPTTHETTGDRRADPAGASGDDRYSRQFGPCCSTPASLLGW